MSPPNMSDLVEEDFSFDSDAENRPPQPPQQQAPAPAATKEAILARRCYAKCLDTAFQEAQANTADRAKREALSNVAESWSALDEIDPEGELLLLKAMIERINTDPRLAAALLPGRPEHQPARSLRHHPPNNKASIASSNATLVDSFSSSTDPTLLTPSPSPSKPARRPSELSTPSSSPSKHHQRESSSPSKLVLNPQNPHLRKMRSSQALQDQKDKAALEEKMPARQMEPGMEHVGLVADVLYGRWAEGLKSRWPLA